MFDFVELWWAGLTFWDKIKLAYVVVVLFTIVMFIFQRRDKNPKKYLQMIQKATEENCVTVGKLTCLTLHGVGKPEHYHAEYMYFVDNKQYFVTFKMWYIVPADDRKDEMNADNMLLNLSNAMVLFYDKKDPSRVISKIEAFTSIDAFSQIPTPKGNRWRNTEIDWTSPIDLVKY